MANIIYDIYHSILINSYSSFPNGKKVSCGAWKLSAVDTNEEALNISEIINHPEYNPYTYENDIAVLKLNGSFNCSQGKIWPACLPNENVSIYTFYTALNTFSLELYICWME